MKIKYFLIPLLILLSAIFSPFIKNACSEELLSAPMETPKSDQFDTVKTEISGLIEDNKKLEVEYSLLYEEFESLVQQLNLRKQEIKNLQDSAGISTDDLNERPILVNEPGGNPNDILVLESRINYLKTRLGNLEEQNNARKMQIDSLRYQKGELEIEIKMKNYLELENDKQGSNKLDKLKADIQKIQEEEKIAVNRIAEIEEEKQMYPQRIEELRRTNKELQDKIIELEKQKELKSRENANLRDKKLLEELLAERAMSAREEEKRKMELSYNNMEAEYSKLDQEVSSKLQSQDQNRDMLRNLIQVDKENQDLRDRIANLKNQIGQLNQK